MELINTVGTRVRVRDEHADRLIAAGYTRPDPAPTENNANNDGGQPARPARRTTTRAGRRATTRS